MDSLEEEEVLMDSVPVEALEAAVEAAVEAGEAMVDTAEAAVEAAVEAGEEAGSGDVAVRAAAGAGNW